MKALILCGGLGTRLRPLTFAIPKPLLPVGDLTLLEANLLWLKSQGADDVAISLGWRAEVIKSYLGKSKFGFDLFYTTEDNPLGTAGPLALVKNWLGNDDLFVMNGDILTKLNLKKLKEFHDDCVSGLTVCAKSYVTKSRFGVIHIQKNAPNLLSNIVEKPEYRELVSAGMYMVAHETLDFIPSQTTYSMPQLAYDCNLKESGAAHVYQFSEPWTAVETLEDLDTVGHDPLWLDWIDELKRSCKEQAV